MKNGNNKQIHSGKDTEKKKSEGIFRTPPMATKANLIQFAKTGLDLYKKGRKVTISEISKYSGLTYEEARTCAKYVIQTKERFSGSFLSEDDIKRYKGHLKELERKQENKETITRKIQRLCRITIFEIETNGTRQSTNDPQNYGIVPGKYVIYFDNLIGIPYIIPISDSQVGSDSTTGGD